MPCRQKLSHKKDGIPDKKCIATYALHIKKKYLEQTVPAEGLLEHSNEICRLAMIHKEKFSRHNVKDDYIQRTITGKVDDILHMNTPVELKHIFSGVHDERKTVLIEGAPGAGKSSLSLNICKKWSTGELFQKFCVVILVRLRDPHVQASKTIANLLPYCDLSVAEELESVIIASQGEGILWVLDGWDEFPERLKKAESCLVRNLIYVQNHNSSVIVTSRPTSSVSLHPLVSRRIEILGFTPDELKKYFEHRLNTKNDESKSVEVLIEKIREYPEVHSSCYLPLHAGFIADTYLQRSTLPSTQYGMFETVVVKCISRNQVKQEKGEIQSLDNLPIDLRKCFDNVCELAYKGVLENKIIFTEDDLPQDFDHLDLLQEVASIVAFHGGISRTYNFLHLSIQEFLAAQHLATKPQYEQYWLFRGLMEDDRCLPMLTFYAAKTKLSAPGIGEFVSTVGDRYLCAEKEHEKEQLCGLLSFVFKCVCETEDPSLCKPLVLALNEHFFEVKTIFDYYSLGSFLSLTINTDIGTGIKLGELHLKSTQEEDVYFSDDDIGVPYITDLASTYKNKSRVVQEVDWNLFLKGLFRFYSGQCVTDIEVSQVIISLSNSQLLLNVVKKAPFLRLLKVTIINEEDRPHKKKLPVTFEKGKILGDVLGSVTIVKILKLENVSLTCAVWQHIGDGLRANTSLHELYIVNCGVTAKDVKNLCEGLCLNRYLETLCFIGNPIKDGIEHISVALQQNGTLKKLVLDNSKITAPLLSGAHIRTMGYIRYFDLSNNTIGNRALKSLVSVFQTSKTLHTLVLHNCGISSKASKSLLRYFTSGTPKTLSIKPVTARGDSSRAMFHSKDYGYSKDSLLELSIDDEGAAIIWHIIADNHQVQTIIIDASNINQVNLNSIFTAFQSNSVVKYFHVYGGKMSIDEFNTLGKVLTDNQSLLTVCIGNEVIELRDSYQFPTPLHHHSSFETVIPDRDYSTALQSGHRLHHQLPTVHTQLSWYAYQPSEESTMSRSYSSTFRPPQYRGPSGNVFSEIIEFFTECLQMNKTLKAMCLPVELSFYRRYFSSFKFHQKLSVYFSSYKPSFMHRL